LMFGRSFLTRCTWGSAGALCSNKPVVRIVFKAIYAIITIYLQYNELFWRSRPYPRKCCL
jgi:hypothetical protein